MSERYSKSEEMHKRALGVIPGGTQTFSKSKTQYPFGVSPYFIQKGKGSHVWDIDGNEYIDYVSGLASITLGYNDPDVTEAVKEQLEQGVIFSLPHPVEVILAEKIREMVPSAEMVRFGKNGSDATSGAIRLARAFTNREHVIVCGYHGWQDWYIGSTARNKGVPKVTRELTHSFPYNDLEALKKLFVDFKDQVAAVILEPMNVTEPKPGFLEAVKEIAHKNGALLIFDETITGFRYSNGGAQEYFGVKPDLSTFGKGLANGYPISAIAGRADIMGLMEEIFFSFTFGGEALSIAAAFATLKKLQEKPVLETIAKQGQKLKDGIGSLIKKLGADEFISISGHPTWSFLTFKDTGSFSQWQIKTLFMQEIFLRGILSLGSHNMSYAHSDSDVQKTLEVYDEVFGIIKKGIDSKNLEKLLKCSVLEPLFKVR